MFTEQRASMFMGKDTRIWYLHAKLRQRKKDIFSLVEKDKDRREGIPLLFQTMPHFPFSCPHPNASLHFDFKNTFGFLHNIHFLGEGCISPKHCFSGWKDIKPWFIQTVSFPALCLRPQSHEPPSTAEEQLTKRRKILTFLNPPSPSFLPSHLSSIYDDLHSPSLHSFSPSIIFKLSTNYSTKSKGRNCFSVRLDSWSGMQIKGQKTIQYLWHTVYVVLTQMACFTCQKIILLGFFPLSFFYKIFKSSTALWRLWNMKIILSQT